MPFLQHADTDLFLATRFYSLLDASEAASQSSIKGVTVIPLGAVPKKIFHRTSQKGLAGILQGGMIPGSSRSDRSHNYLSEKRISDAAYMSGMRSTQPVEVTIDPAKAMQAGCEFFVNETEGVLTRGIIPPSAVITAVDTTKKDLPIYVADESIATRKGEPGTTFRAKREYEEAASASPGPPPLPRRQQQHQRPWRKRRCQSPSPRQPQR